VIKTFLKGMAMGAADIVPGVSGGTIALLTGIYERLINGIKSVGPETVKILFSKGIPAAWKQIDGNFLLAVVLGIGTSILVFARVIHYLLDHYPIPVWASFFGLVLACIWFVGKQVEQWQWQRVAMLILGVLIAGGIASSNPTEVEATPLILFACGALAICAMILPGISGSFIMLLLGVYGTIIGAIKSFDMAILSIFAAGCLVGIMGFSRVLSWVLSRYHSATLALLTGFMVGALIKVWPWKAVLSYRTNSKGESVPFIDTPVAPWNHPDPQLLVSLVVFVLAFLLVLWAEKVAERSIEDEK